LADAAHSWRDLALTLIRPPKVVIKHTISTTNTVVSIVADTIGWDKIVIHPASHGHLIRIEHRVSYRVDESICNALVKSVSA
jgi:hypothetical protein